ncbi:MAG: hypothetical protein P8Y60_05660 [Calditrichota bacterium]|jgi:hypothetical protein
MSALKLFNQSMTDPEKAIMAQLTDPNRIQLFLDELPYSADPFYRCPLQVLREKTAHCFDGALFAAAALRQIGYQPLILDMIPNQRDDDHLLAVYQQTGHWGAIAKSNFVGLRFREPVYRSLRELVMSYFEQYYNVEREKTLRGYTVPLNLEHFDKFHWMTQPDHLEKIANKLDQIRRFNLLTVKMAKHLALLDQRSYHAGLLGVNEKGLFRP